eukprot:UN28376
MPFVAKYNAPGARYHAENASLFKTIEKLQISNKSIFGLWQDNYYAIVSENSGNIFIATVVVQLL